VDGDHANAVFFEIAGRLAVEPRIGDQGVDLIDPGEGGEGGFAGLGAVGEEDHLARARDDQALGIGLLGVGRGEALLGGEPDGADEGGVDMDLFEGEAGHGADKGLGEAAQFAADEDDGGSAGGQGAGDAEGIGDDGEIVPGGEQAGERQDGAAAIEKEGVVRLDILEGGFGDGLFLGGGDGGFVIENGFGEHGIQPDGPPMNAADFALAFELGEVAPGGGGGDLEAPAEVVHPDDAVFPEDMPHLFEALRRQIALLGIDHFMALSIKIDQI